MTVFKDLLKHDRRFLVGFIILLLVLALASLSFFSPYKAEKRRVVKRNLEPSWQHPLGGNAMGQDIFWKLTYATRNSLLLGVLAALFSRIIAMANGLISGYVGGRTDRILIHSSPLRTSPPWVEPRGPEAVSRPADRVRGRPRSRGRARLQKAQPPACRQAGGTRGEGCAAVS